MIAHTIFYVSDQNRSTQFYKQVLGIEPRLYVPGMTEFKLSENHILGLMPENGIKKLLRNKISETFAANDVPRAELYIRVEKPEKMFEIALKLGARELDPIISRDWGDRAGYVMDCDGYVLAFANE